MFYRLPAVLSLVILILATPSVSRSQLVVDKTVATVTDGVRTELITLSDLKWQLALQPNVTLTPASSEDLNRALRLLIDQRLFAIEAERLPRDAPTKQEITAKVNEIVSYFATPAEFERRLNLVGFKSVSDPNFERIISERIAIDKYLAFRFRSFIVITADDEARYYRDVYVPEFRRRNPGVIVPALESRRATIVEALTEQRVGQQIETFLEEAKRRAEIVILNPV
ncbi:MAG TPA: hypothetical protein VNA22_05430 [Pyrinomonadaceae bacterium]|nr:hypothetical protein [Pyrinomonadaceae bacterium]